MANVELEASLARKPAIYLRLDLDARSLEIKARGAVLDKVPVKAVEGALRQPFFKRVGPLVLPVPVVLEVTQGPGDTDREIVAPPSLRPAGSSQDEEPTPASQGLAPT
ncbi:MAG: hypothetical protein ACP5NF_06165, partial [Thermoanaerobaculum sp.]